MCFRNELPKDSYNTTNMSIEKFKSLIDNFKPRYLNMGPGGEPLLHPAFFEIVRYAKQKGIKVIVSTNGTMLANKEIAQNLVRSGLDVLKISIDAPDPEVYRQIRRQDCFDKILEGIKKICHYKKELKSAYPGLRLDIVIMKENHNRLMDIIILAKEHSIKHIFFRALNYSNFSQDKINDLTGGLEVESLRKELKKAYRFANVNKIKTNLGWLAKNAEEIFSLYDFKDRGHAIRLKNKPVCILPWISILIDVKGGASHCCRLNLVNALRNTPDMPSDQNIKELWNGKDFQRTRSIHASRHNYRMHETCSQCTDLISVQDALNTIRLFPLKNGDHKNSWIN